MQRRSKRYESDSALIMLAAMLLALCGPVHAADDIATLAERVTGQLITPPFVRQEGEYDIEQVGRWLAAMDDAGAWADIDYDDTSRTAWAPAQHLTRLRDMTVAYVRRDSPYVGDRALFERIIAGLEYWYRTEPTSDSRWQLGIREDLVLAPIVVLLGDELPDPMMEQALARLHQGVGDYTALDRGTDTDELLVDQILIYRALATRDDALLEAAIQHMQSELEITRRTAGIKPDYSYHNHGPQLYNGGYGLSALHLWSRWAYLTRDTAFAFDDDKIELLVRFVLDGYRWMTWHALLDYHALGRGIANADSDKAAGIREVCTQLAAVTDYRRDELHAYRRHIDGDAPAAVGNKHYPYSNFMTHRRPGFYTSVRIASRDVVGGEALNGTNLKGYYVPFGGSFILRDGDEYEGIFPVWDWTRVPGVTAPHDPPPPTLIDAMGQTVRIRGTTDFAGGVSNGAHGMMALDYDRNGVTGRKAWFYFDDLIVCLGADVTAPHDAPIVTSVNQCLRDGPITIGGATMGADVDRELARPAWVLHDGVGYIFPDDAGPAVRLRAAEQSGSPRDTFMKGDARAVTKRVFSLWLDHGRQPEAAQYHYVIAPTADRETFDRPLPIEVVANAPRLQAVRHLELDVTMLAFYRAGAAKIGPYTELAVDAPCLVLLERQADGAPSVTVADPRTAPEGVAVNVTLRSNSGRISIAGGEWRFRLDPDGVGKAQGWHTPDYDDSHWREVVVPASLQELGVVESDYVGTGWYRTTFALPDGDAWRRGPVYLHIARLDASGDVYINGRHAGGQPPGAPRVWEEPLHLDITPFVRDDGVNTLAIKNDTTGGLMGIWGLQNPVYLTLQSDRP